MIDLRSDTVTRPTSEMLEAMRLAPVGDDVFGEDESVNELERKAAARFGHEAGLFCPSGTMTNQIAIKAQTQPGDEVLCHELAHLYTSEGGGIGFHSGASVRLFRGDHGRFTAEDVRANINPTDDPHFPRTSLVTLENTVSRGGGACWDLEEIRRIRATATEAGLALHLDGARLFNALVARGESALAYGPVADTISICLSKGLGAPVGSVLLGSRALIAEARRYRKVMGGGMRQAGFLAAAGSYALDHHVDRLALDHEHARAVADELEELPAVEAVLPTVTNIVLFQLVAAVRPAALLEHLRSREILALASGRSIRMVFHLDVSEAQTDAVIAALRTFRAAAG
jgi:threonine aldolase